MDMYWSSIAPLCIMSRPCHFVVVVPSITQTSPSIVVAPCIRQESPLVVATPSITQASPSIVAAPFYWEDPLVTHFASFFPMLLESLPWHPSRCTYKPHSGGHGGNSYNQVKKTRIRG